MFKSKKIISIILTIVVIVSANCIGVFAAENNNSTPEQTNLQKAIRGEVREESSKVKLSSIPVGSEEEAAQLIEKLEQTAKIVEVEVTREKSNTAQITVADIAKVSCKPTYGYRKGHVEVYLEIWVDGGGIDTWLTKCTGYVAAATNIDGVRMKINYTNYFPSKVMYITEESDIMYNLYTDLVLYEGLVTVYLTGGWTPADIFLDHEMYL